MIPECQEETLELWGMLTASIYIPSQKSNRNIGNQVQGIFQNKVHLFTCYPLPRNVSIGIPHSFRAAKQFDKANPLNHHITTYVLLSQIDILKNIWDIGISCDSTTETRLPKMGTSPMSDKERSSSGWQYKCVCIAMRLYIYMCRKAKLYHVIKFCFPGLVISWVGIRHQINFSPEKVRDTIWSTPLTFCKLQRTLLFRSKMYCSLWGKNN